MWGSPTTCTPTEWKARHRQFACPAGNGSASANAPNSSRKKLYGDLPDVTIGVGFTTSRIARGTGRQARAFSRKATGPLVVTANKNEIRGAHVFEPHAQLGREPLNTSLQRVRTRFPAAPADLIVIHALGRRAFETVSDRFLMFVGIPAGIEPKQVNRPTTKRL